MAVSAEIADSQWEGVETKGGSFVLEEQELYGMSFPYWDRQGKIQVAVLYTDYQRENFWISAAGGVYVMSTDENANLQELYQAVFGVKK